MIKPYAVVAMKPKAPPESRRREQLQAPKEPWNESVMADLEQRHASKYFLLVSEESCRLMADTGAVPIGVQEQCRNLLSWLDEPEPSR